MTTRSTCSASTASAASSARWRPASWSIPALGGAGIPDYLTNPGTLSIAEYSSAQFISQVKAVLMAIVWSGVGSFILFKLVDLVMGLRVTVEREREGLDVAEHGERAYNY